MENLLVVWKSFYLFKKNLCLKLSTSLTSLSLLARFGGLPLLFLFFLSFLLISKACSNSEKEIYGR